MRVSAARGLPGAVVARPCAPEKWENADMGCNVSKDVKVEDQGNNAAGNNDGGDNTQMSEEKAAEKIQASFRGYKTRKTLKDNGVVLPSKANGDVEEKTEEKKELGSGALSTDPEEIVDIDLTDAEVMKAAAKIQASYRNFSAKKKEQQDASSTPPPENKETAEHDELDDIDLGDPEVEKAALKIQSTFRGYKVRKETTVNGQEGEEEQ